MRLLAMTALWPLCLAALSSGCAAPQGPDIRLIERPVPAGLLVCPERPAPPGAERTQRDVALYLLALASAHDACRARLAAVARLLSPPAP